MTTATNPLVSGGFAFESPDAWAKIPDGFNFNEVAGLSVDQDDNLYVFVRAPMADGSAGTRGRILVFDKAGNFQFTFAEGVYGGRAHAIHVSPDGFVYEIENTRHAVEKYTRKGTKRSRRLPGPQLGFVLEMTVVFPSPSEWRGANFDDLTRSAQPRGEVSAASPSS